MDEISAWNSLLTRIGHRAENTVDWIKRRAVSRFEFDRPLHIIPYCGYGTAQTSTLQGRVLEYQERITPDTESLWHNLQQSYRRFETDEVPNVTVQANVDGHTVQTQTDEEGYFFFEFDTPKRFGEVGAPVNLQVALSLPDHAEQSMAKEAQVVIPSQQAKFGVISDIDDTIIITGATSIIEMMRLTFLESSRSRVALPGVSEFYNALHRDINPFFYVSSSPWNLYEFLTDFISINNIVAGPLFLRDYGIDNDKFIVNSHGDHKTSKIKTILDRYPDLPFILIGDSGQHDPEIYGAICNEYPDQILSCYIRDVSGAFRDYQVQDIIEQLSSKRIDMLLIPDTTAAATHSIQKGFINSEALPAISAAVETDRLPINQVL